MQGLALTASTETEKHALMDIIDMRMNRQMDRSTGGNIYPSSYITHLQKCNIQHHILQEWTYSLRTMKAVAKLYRSANSLKPLLVK